jgi:DNA-directed RNA polymerase subunit M/transcription elongation factor TFIIS
MKKGLLIAAMCFIGARMSFAQTAPAAEKTVKTTKTAKSKQSKKAATETAKVMYECPMKCEPATAKAGKCGKCGMDLKARKA